MPGHLQQGLTQISWPKPNTLDWKSSQVVWKPPPSQRWKGQQASCQGKEREKNPKTKWKDEEASFTSSAFQVLSSNQEQTQEIGVQTTWSMHLKRNTCSLHQHAINHWKCSKTMKTGKQKLQPSSWTSMVSKPRSTTQTKSWGHWPWKLWELPIHLPPGQELIQMCQQKKQQKIAEVGFSLSSPRAAPSGSLKLQGSSQLKSWRLHSAHCSPNPESERETPYKHSVLDLTTCPSCSLPSPWGSRSSAIPVRSCPCLTTKHLWPSSRPLPTVVLEAMRQ